MHKLRVSLSRLVFNTLYVTSACVCLPHAVAQKTAPPDLIGRSLFLRGFWLADQLNFDSTGHLTGTSDRGPVTLSGMDVKRVHQTGNSLQIEGTRVALVASPDGKPGLQRVPITSTTHILFSLRPASKRDFHAEEQVRIKIQANSHGDFDQALAKVFGEDSTDLAASVPPYWQCYAKSYFKPVIAPNAEQQVEQCVITPRIGLPDDTQLTRDEADQPRAIYTVSPVLTELSAELHVQGMALIHARVKTDGTPVGLQIVRAIGGGADESILEAVSHWRFTPGQKDGVPITADVTIRVQIQPPA